MHYPNITISISPLDLVPDSASTSQMYLGIFIDMT